SRWREQNNWRDRDQGKVRGIKVGTSIEITMYMIDLDGENKTTGGTETRATGEIEIKDSRTIGEKGTLPSDTVLNPKNNNHCMAITTRGVRVFGPIAETRVEEHDEKEEIHPKPFVANKTVVINVDLDENAKLPVVAKEDEC
ncbi:hypothetical protein HAX54_045488, partial [Datura stramonium]|nr:hypothetical protein [Datura stramonium]